MRHRDIPARAGRPERDRSRRRRARVAGAPITWGVCEVAGWGHQLPAERVLREAAAAGLRAIEVGPPGFLPTEPGQAGRLLARHGLGLAGGFLAVVLHCSEQQEQALALVAAAARSLSASGAHVLALAAAAGGGDDTSGGDASLGTGGEAPRQHAPAESARDHLSAPAKGDLRVEPGPHEIVAGPPQQHRITGEPASYESSAGPPPQETLGGSAPSECFGPMNSESSAEPDGHGPLDGRAQSTSPAEPAAYESCPELSLAEWSVLLTGLARASDLAAQMGVTIALHPHYGTMIARRHHIARVLETSDVPLCLDTGHLLIGGADPLDIVREAATRVVHVHLKDVDADMAGRVRRGEIGYRSAVSRGLYRPLGAGDVDVRGVIDQLEASAYRGWYVLEQDTVLTAEPPEGSGPAAAAQRSIEFLKEVISG